MLTLSAERLTAYRAETFHLLPDLRVTTREQAIDFVARRGFVYFWPVKGVVLPSLWAAVAGDRPVPNEHDDPGHVTWGWKDEMLGARRWYYAKVLRKKATFIALDVVPCFYALSENYGEPEQDYLLQYQEGRLTFEAKAVYEALLNEGPLDSISLRRLARLGSGENQTRFNRALELLQADFKILPVGVAQAGAWKYAFIYDLVHRFYPDLPEQARPIRQAEARRRLAELYLQSVGAASQKTLMALFGWSKGDAEAALHALAQDGSAVKDVTLADQPGLWAVSSLVR
ncbi:MAG TPA: crosslink repair DNA glycosylase YcaQ family protein [Anaerolineae bacterium]|nr:crosslink repair DNA glycosylase YcaQ family protein [Anaerolineae bacterium]HNU04831.1 crosslink repair DNA glycosylase YcaQ family protein [Anaerolineae bacterium]